MSEAKLQITRLEVGPVRTNCYLVCNEETKEVIIFDPGENGVQISNHIKENGWTLKAILLTHGHFDHISAVDELRKAFQVPVYAHEAEKEVLENPNYNCSLVFGSPQVSITADEYVRDGQILSMVGCEITVIYTPGHTVGGCCYYFKEQHILISGDTLFHTTIGRTDLPTGSYASLATSVKEKLFVLPDDTKVLPGHESTTTIGFEKQYNML